MVSLVLKSFMNKPTNFQQSALQIRGIPQSLSDLEEGGVSHRGYLPMRLGIWVQLEGEMIQVWYNQKQQ